MASTLREFKAELFRSLGSPIRIHILEELRTARSLTVTELQERIGIGPSNLSQHLAVLRARAVVTGRRDGTSVFYSVADPSVFTLLDAARAFFDHQMAQRRTFVDGAGV